jgi:glyoxylase-like metal-dependent hydrolase (beta-lactamase superfamily II)
VTIRITRRSALIAGAVLPFATTMGAGVARAAAEMKGPSTPIHYRAQLGRFEVTTLRAGTGTSENPQETFGLNATPEEFAAVSAAAFIPADRSQNFFNPTVVNTGSELVLFDTGPSAEGTLAALEAAGYSADQVDTVVITHMHGDHIGGLATEAGLTYPNARYVTGAIENNHWAAAGNENYDRLIKPIADQFTYLDDGGSVASGITAIAAYGHTPGHFVYHLESDGQRLVITADMANHAVWSIGRPDWEVRFDMDKPAAIGTRKRILGMLAADRVPFAAYHLPTPAIGYVEAVGEGFRHVPVGYQLMLNSAG